jgi:hypothetical protein
MVRGAQMLIIMKVVSVGFDVDSGALVNIPNASEFYGYALHVGSVVFGPWIPFKDYLASLDAPPLVSNQTFYIRLWSYEHDDRGAGKSRAVDVELMN